MNQVLSEGGLPAWVFTWISTYNHYLSVVGIWAFEPYLLSGLLGCLFDSLQTQFFPLPRFFALSSDPYFSLSLAFSLPPISYLNAVYRISALKARGQEIHSLKKI